MLSSRHERGTRCHCTAKKLNLFSFCLLFPFTQHQLEEKRERLSSAHAVISEQEESIRNYKKELVKALEEVHLARSQKKEAEEKIGALNGEIRRLTAAVDEATERGNVAEEKCVFDCLLLFLFPFLTYSSYFILLFFFFK